MTTHIALIRHAHYQQLPDTPSAWQPFPLTEEGEQQAADCARLLRQFAQDLDLEIAQQIHCSTSLRAWQTAHIIADGLSTKIKAYELQQDDALRERGVGIFANLSVAQIEAALAADPRCANPPAGWKSSSAYCLPDSAAESLNQAGQRVSHCLSRIASQTKEDGQLQLVVAHGASIRHAARDLGIISSEEIPQLSMHYAVPVICEVSDNGWRRVAGSWKQRAPKNASKQSVEALD